MQVDHWTERIKMLAKIVEDYPQSAHTAISKSMQAEWKFIQRIIPEIANLFNPLNSAIQTIFFPSLLGNEVSEDES